MLICLNCTMMANTRYILLINLVFKYSRKQEVHSICHQSFKNRQAEGTSTIYLQKANCRKQTRSWIQYILTYTGVTMTKWGSLYLFPKLQNTYELYISIKQKIKFEQACPLSDFQINYKMFSPILENNNINRILTRQLSRFRCSLLTIANHRMSTTVSIRGKTIEL